MVRADSNPTKIFRKGFVASQGQIPFRQENGIFPAYHMSKAHWLTVALDGTVKEDKLKFLTDMSYDLTK